MLTRKLSDQYKKNCLIFTSHTSPAQCKIKYISDRIFDYLLDSTVFCAIV